mmetsp:Transcript_1755/g.2449  ORF Transcript_1755/g.2449 Transcript_1755/m.2449 type:complete len:496 (+) Transcript_1755:218-1705(+)
MVAITHHQLIVSTVLALVVGTAIAEKDGNAYPWGTNPNVQAQMYWRDASNILEDLDQFESLFIRVHGCVWSPYYDADAHDDDDNTDDDGDEAARDGDENWYLYRSQSFRANTAFSLYGNLKGDMRPGRHCSKATYINSFFTFEGAAKFSELFGIYDDLATSECVEVEEDSNSGSGDRIRRRLSGSGDDGYSATMGCSAYGDFEWAEFANGYCDGHYYMNATDTMQSYNKKMLGGNFNCRKVYSRWRNIQGRNLEDAAGDDDGAAANDDAAAAADDAYVADDYAAYGDDNVTYVDDDEYGGNYSSIGELVLASSSACDINQYPNGVCPDPYGLKVAYQRAMENARTGRNNSTPMTQRVMQVLSCLFLLFAASLFLSVYFKKTEKEHGYVSNDDYMLREDKDDKTGGGSPGRKSRRSRKSGKRSPKKSSKKTPEKSPEASLEEPTLDEPFDVASPEAAADEEAAAVVESPKKTKKSGWFGKKEEVVETTGPTAGTLA